MPINASKYGAPLTPGQAIPGDTSKYGTPMTPQAPPQGEGFFSKLFRSVPDQFHAGIDQIRQGAHEIGRGGNPIEGAESGLRIESGIASVLTSPLAPLFYPATKAIETAADVISDKPAVQEFAQTGAGQAVERVAEDVSNTANVAGTISGGNKTARVAPKAASGAERAATGVVEAIAPPLPHEAAILDRYNRAVKPTVAGKTGPGQLDAYNGNVVSAVKAITENKPKLRFEDDYGSVVEGELPHTRGEFADALGQAKKAIFGQYDELAKRTNGTGARISLEPAVTALDDVVNNQALQITNPDAVAYAKRIQQNLQEQDGVSKSVDPETAQQVIANWNGALKAFYRNPSYETASRAAIDAGVVAEVRKSLDKAIEDATGEDYQGLKRQYGALSSIERDVNKAAIAEAKKTGTNTSGLGKYVDVFAGGDIASGLLSLNPALFAKGAAQIGISHFFQWYNSPDRAVANMFKAAEKGE